MIAGLSKTSRKSLATLNQTETSLNLPMLNNRHVVVDPDKYLTHSRKSISPPLRVMERSSIIGGKDLDLKAVTSRTKMGTDASMTVPGSFRKT